MEDRISNVKTYLEEMITASHKFAFKEINFSLNHDLWIKSNSGAINDTKLKIIEDGTFNIHVNTGKQIYLSYMENTIRFASIPQLDFGILSGKKYSVSFLGNCEENVNVRLYIVSYSEKEKIQQSIIDINKETEIEFDERCTKHRIALRFVGQGKVKIESIKFEPVKFELINKDIIPNAKMNYKRKINNVSEVKIAGILDEFSQKSFSKECEVITFTPYNFVEILDGNRPDFLLVESAWKGINGSWEFKIAKYNNQDKSQLYGLINYCKSNGIPTVFWNKEDPIHYEKFIDTAKLFDYVFTTDRNIIDKYKQACEHENVFSLPFAAQVKSNNPVNKYVRKKGVCFAGSYYGNRHADRKRDMDNVLKACTKYGLDIYDRNYRATLENPNSPFKYPVEFEENVKGSLPYSQIDKAYKGYEVMLNVNSVKDSPTMFSRRVFEGLACGTPIISTYSKGINEMFGNIVISDDDEKKLSKKIDRLMKDKTYWKKISLSGIREVMLNHTYENRIFYILNKLKIDVDIRDKKVSLIVIVNHYSDVQKAIKLKENSKYKDIELVMISSSLFNGYIDCINKYNTEEIKFYTGEFLRRNYTAIKEITSGDFVSFIDLKNLYGESYILDLIATTKYTNADIVGKKSYYSIKSKNRSSKENNKLRLVNEDFEYQYVSSLKLDRCLVKVCSIEDEDLVELLDLFKNGENIDKLFKRGFQVFSSDNNNFIENGSITKIDNTVLDKIIL